MGQVYLVDDLMDPSKPLRALKFLQIAAGEEERFLAFFKREFQTLSLLRHPSLAQAFDFGIDRENGRAFYTVEFVAGKDLFQSTRGLAMAETLQLLAAVCRAVDFIHSKGILHNDLKPGNILVEDQTQKPKLLDFGLSQVLADFSASTANATPQSAVRMGTPEYMAPEILRGEPPSFRSDLYALGMIFYRVLTGRLPFAEKSRRATLHVRTHRKVPSPRQHNPSMNRDLEILILQMLSTDPDRRPRSALDVLRTLDLLTQDPVSRSVDTDHFFSFAQSPHLVGRDSVMHRIERYVRAKIPVLESTQISGFDLPETTSADLVLSDLLMNEEEVGFCAITGEEGIGKTSLLNFMKQRLQIQELTCLSTEGHVRGEAFAPWRRVLLELSGLLAKEGAALHAHQTLLSFLNRQAVAKAAPSPPDRITLFSQAAGFLAAAFEEQPYLILLDDLDEMDELSQSFVTYLDRLGTHVSRLRLPPLVLSMRERIHVERVLRSGRGVMMNLPALSQEQCAILLQEAFHVESVATWLAERMHQQSGGNPRYFQEILRELMTSGNLKRQGGDWNLEKLDAGSIPIPPSLAQLVRKRFETFSKTQKEMIAFASIWRGAISVEVLPALLGASRSKAMDQELNALCLQEVLREIEPGSYVPYRKGLDEVLGQSFPEVSSLHARCAQYLEKKRPQPAGALAWHYTYAKRPELAAPMALTAGTLALQQWLQEEALELFWLAAEQAGKAGLPAREVEAKSKIGEILWRQGQRAQACEIYAKLLSEKMPGGHELERAQAGRALGIAARDRGEYAKAIEFFKSALAELADQDPVLAADLAGQAAFASLGLGKTKQMQDWIARATQGLQKKNLKSPLFAQVHILLGFLYLQIQDYSKARTLFEAALQISETRKDSRTQAVALINLASVAAQREQLAEAAELFEKGAVMARAVGDSITHSHALNYLGGVEYIRGHYGKAGKLFHEALDLAVRIDSAKLLAALHASLGQLETERGNYLAARNHFDQSRTLYRGLKDTTGLRSVQLGLAILYQQIGLWEEAKEYAEAAGKKTRESQEQLNALLVQAGILTAMARFDDADLALKKSEQIVSAQAVHDQRVLLSLAQAELSLARNQPKAAREILQSSSKECNRTQNQMNRLFWQLAGFRSEFAQGETASRAKTEKAMEFLRQFETFVEDALSTGNFTLQWRSLALWAQMLEQYGETPKALPIWQRAGDLIQRVGDGLEPAWRQAFFADPERQTIREAILRLSQSGMNPSQALRTAQDQIEHYQKLLAINRQISACWKNSDSLLHFILDTALDLVAARRAFLVLSVQGGFRLGAARNRAGDEKWQPVSEYSRMILTEVISQGIPRVYGDVQHDPTLQESVSARNLNLRSVVCVPLCLGHEIIGALYLDHDQKPAAFARAQVDLLLALADQSSLVLSQSRAYGELEQSAQEISQRLQRAESQLQQHSKELEWQYNYARILGGKDPAMRKVFDLLDRVANADGTVLIQGESGTGKELVAQAIHFNSRRKTKPFIPLNCAGLTANLLESELFGHVKGAFTGADANHEGLLAQADGGTVFLDEVADLPLPLQSKLLRVLQDKKIRPLGASEERQVNIRILSASNKLLAEQVREQKFREDLYYRLHVFQIDLPPLRERPLDLDLLIDSFLGQLSKKGNRKRRHLSERARRFLHSYPWPGNVRELAHVLEYAVSLSPRRRIELEDLPPYLSAASQEKLQSPLALEKARDEFHRKYFRELLEYCQGHITKAAKIAGVHRETLSRLMKKYRKLE